MSTSLLALLDDISAVLDDVAAMTKVATKKTAGVLGDDLALNAEQVAGARADRELSVVWAVAKGSALNKAMLVPGALAISTWLPALIIPLMLFGGTLLCFEGVEKLIDGFKRRRQATPDVAPVEPVLTDAEREQQEATKIRGAIRTDLVLSAEIVVIGLGAVSEESFGVRALTLVAVSIIATVGIYGLVGGIVKLDDLGLLLQKRSNAIARLVGRGLLHAAPKLMRALSAIGTAAVFLVGGGIVSHSVKRLERWSAGLEAKVADVQGVGPALAWLTPSLFDAALGLLLGGVSVAIVAAGRRLWNRPATATP